MNMKELVKAVKPQIEEILEVKLSEEKVKQLVFANFNTIAEAIKNGDKVDVTGFGKFESVERAQRNGVNPSTGERIVIPASKAPKFKPAKALKDLVKG